MNSTTEYKIWLIIKAVYSKGIAFDTAHNIVAPLTWWVSTGRCAGSHVRVINNLNSRQVTTIANRLIKADGDYRVAIDSVVDYLAHIGA